MPASYLVLNHVPCLRDSTETFSAIVLESPLHVSLKGTSNLEAVIYIHKLIILFLVKWNVFFCMQFGCVEVFFLSERMNFKEDTLNILR